MNGCNQVTTEARKKLTVDLWIIGIVTFLALGIVVVRKETGNAWGCILIFFVYWNAI